MEEQIKNQEFEDNKNGQEKDPKSEFQELVALGAYRSMAKNEFFMGLEPEEQINAMQETLQHCLVNRENRFYCLVSNRPDLAERYRVNQLKPLQNALSALDEIAIQSDSEEVSSNQYNTLTPMLEELDEAA